MNKPQSAAVNRPKLNENGEWRCATLHHMGRRLPGWDYRRPAIYVITIVVADRARQPLGAIEVRRGGVGLRLASQGRNGRGAALSAAPKGAGAAGEASVGAPPVRLAPAAQAGGCSAGGWAPLAAAAALGLAPDEVEARVVFSDLGRAIFAHFRRIAEFTPEIDPLYCEVMPDHLHFVLWVRRALKRPLGNAIAGFKTGCEKIAAAMGYGGALWAEGFVDEIIFREGQLAAEFNYLHDNARRRAIKALWPDLFRVVGRLRVGLRLASQGHNGRGAAPTTAPTAGYFSALGNRFLLDRPMAQVQVSRDDLRYKREPKPGARLREASARQGGYKIVRDEKGEPVIEFMTPAFAAKRDALLAAARHGAVLISPCVSDGEREIAREALAAGLRLVTLQNKGFAPLQKPGGRYFDACAAGRLLMLAPAAWPYQVGEKRMTRLDAVALNRLAQCLAGPGAAKINYRGMTPANIDGLALAAVTPQQGRPARPLGPGGAKPAVFRLGWSLPIFCD